MAHDPESLAGWSPINVISKFGCLFKEVLLKRGLVEEIVRFPIPQDEIDRFKLSIGSDASKPRAFIFGHDLWSNVDLQKTVDWLDTILRAITKTTKLDWHSLFVTLNAAGKQKSDDWIVT
jgi:hypothetical protein